MESSNNINPANQSSPFRGLGGSYIYRDLSMAELRSLVQRNVDPANEIRAIVEEVITSVRAHGDKALISYAQKFDKVELQKLYLDKAELEELASALLPGQKQALQTAYQN